MKRRTLIRTAALAMMLFAPAGIRAAETQTWPQWRGPTRDGRISAHTAWPKSISVDSLSEAWSAKLAPSYSGPIVTKDRVFVTETRDRKTEAVRAFDRATGKEIWKKEWPGAMSVPFFAKSNGDWIRATPAYDGKRLYVAGMRDVLVCLDAANGSEMWRVDFVKLAKAPLPAFGCVCSPLIDGDSIYMQAGGGIARLNKLNGELIWHKLKDGGGMYGSAFSSPVIATIRGKRQLVVQTRKKLAGVDMSSGDLLWSTEIPAFRGMNILTPTVIGDRVFTSSYGGGSFLFDINRSEDGVWSATKLWRAAAQGYMSSPVVIGGHVYLHLRNRRLTCLDLETGQSRWTTRPFGRYWSMVVQKDRIFCLDERGELFLVRANPQKFELIDRRKITTEPTWAHLAVCDSKVFVRGLNSLTAYKWKAGK